KPGTFLWHQPVGTATAKSPRVVDGVVYLASTDFYVYALDAATGERRWRYQTGGAVYGGPVVQGDVIYVGSTDGKVHALTRDGTLAWSTTMPGWPVYLSPVVDGQLYAAVSGATGTSSGIGEAFALDPVNGDVTWHVHVSNQTNAITVASGIA